MTDYTRLTYEDYENNMDFWVPQGLVLPNWASELSAMGYKGVSALDFYGDVFKDELEVHRERDDYRTGEYGGILLEIAETILTKEAATQLKARIEEGKTSARLTRKKVPSSRKGRYKWVDVKYKTKRYTVTRDQEILYKRINATDNFLFMAPISYNGKTRENKNARFLFALCIEIDHIKEGSGLKELEHSWKRKVSPVPVPTYIVCSGNGLHLYWVFNKPIPLFANIFKQMFEAKTYLTKLLWSKYITTAYNQVQFESLGQGFRCVGAACKNKAARTMAFKVGDNIDLDYFNSFLPEDKKVNVIYKTYKESKHSLEEAKELYPDWYQRRVMEKQPSGVFYRHRGIYDNWIQKIMDPEQGASVGHRYNCLENLCSLAVQCQIPPEEVEADCRKVAKYLERLTVSEDNHFGEYDIACALRTYHFASEAAFQRNIDIISKKTNIPLIRAKRNGRTQSEHLKVARAVRDAVHPNGEWQANPSKKDLVEEYVKEHPDENPTQIAKALGISRTTVYRYIKKPKSKQTSWIEFFEEEFDQNMDGLENVRPFKELTEEEKKTLIEILSGKSHRE